jgi:nucleotide-binding universal stress UspA family protein
MIKDILVCLEGSASSEAAVGISIELAKELGARLAGLAIVDEPDIRAGAAVGIGAASYKQERDDALVADAHKRADAWVAAFERQCKDAEVSARALEIVGRPAASILAKMTAHDLTILGRDANFRFETEKEDPETRDQILRRGVRPVLLVPEGTRAPLGKKVLIAFDGSGAAKRAAASFAQTGLAATREVHVATVDDDGAAAWEMANKGVLILRHEGVFAVAHNVVSTLSNAEALFELGRELGAGMIVMGAFAHSRLAHLFGQSAMRGLIEKSGIPLYLQH